MTWTWDPSELGTSQLQQVRAELQDTDPANQMLSDEEINHFGTVEANFWGACARCAEAISRGFLRKADVKLGRAMQLTYTTMAKQYLEMARLLRAKAMGTSVPWVGGMSVADKVLYLQDPDIVQAIFTKNMQENPWTGGYTPDSLPPTGNNGAGINGLDEEQIT